LFKHGVVYSECGFYAGWPANNGAWQWGDEFLVGFLRGKYGRADLHYCLDPLEKFLARSKDGGATWTIEGPHKFDGVGATEPPDFDPAKSILTVCGGYDHGGDDCPREGGFYLSRDRGLSWGGPYVFSGMGDFAHPFMNTSRTRVVGDLVFLSRRKESHWGSDEVIISQMGGGRFQRISTVSDDAGRVVMPAVVRVGDSLVMCARRRGRPRRVGWVDSYISKDGGATWHGGGEVAETGGYNGNPPALAEANGVLVCAFANRSKKQMQYAKSVDGGFSWSKPAVLRESASTDIGYPQFFKRSDGALVCVYYFSDAERKHQHIASTEFRI
jgi:hypothetical protein